MPNPNPNPNPYPLFINFVLHFLITSEGSIANNVISKEREGSSSFIFVNSVTQVDPKPKTRGSVQPELVDPFDPIQCAM